MKPMEKKIRGEFWNATQSSIYLSKEGEVARKIYNTITISILVPVQFKIWGVWENG
jgi:hypothetical protein